MDNKRRSERKTKTIKTEVHTEEGMTFSSTADISEGGIFITTPEPIPEGEQVTMTLHFPDGEEIEVSGAVKWNRDESEESRAGMGVEFINVPKDQMDKFTKL